jgi:ribosomal protein L16
MVQRKLSRKKIKLRSKKINKLVIGNYGIKSLSYFELDPKVLEFVKLIVNRFQKKANIINKANFNKSICEQKAHMRMGKGKGKVIKKVAHIKKGQVFLEFTNIKVELMETLFKKLKGFFPAEVKLIKNKNYLYKNVFKNR